MSKNYYYFLLFLLIIIWGVNWPLTKIAIYYFPPLFLAMARMFIASGLLFLYLIIKKKIIIPCKNDLPIILTVSIFQMAGFIGFSNLGLSYIHAGRSAFLAYTASLWVIPIAYFFYHEHISREKYIGFILGITGIIFLFNPIHFNWNNNKEIIGNIELLFGSLLWAIAILHVRYSKTKFSVIQLLPWQLLIAATILLLFSIKIDNYQSIKWTSYSILLLMYISVVATAFAYWCLNEAGKKLPTSTTSLALLAIPVIGLISSALLLQEPIYWSTIIALILIITGLTFILRSFL